MNVDGFGAPIGKGKPDKILKNDTFNAPPVPNVYNTNRKQAYYQANNIKDVFKKKRMKMLKKRNEGRQEVKMRIGEKMAKLKEKNIKGIAGARLQHTLPRRDRWGKDMSQTTELRKNRRFKPM